MTYDENRGTGLVGDTLAELLAATTDLPANELTKLVDLAGQALGAISARVLIADYGLTSLQELGEDGPTGPRLPIEGTLAGRAFSGTDVVVSGDDPVLVHVPLSEGSERLGVLELTHGSWGRE